MSGGPQGDHDILFAFPGETLSLGGNGKLAGRYARSGGFLDALDRWWRDGGRADNGVPGLPFAGGWFLYLGYELAAEIEPRLKLPAATDPLPAACAVRVPAAIIRSRDTPGVTLVAEPGAGHLLEPMRADLLARDEAVPGPPVGMDVGEDPPARFTAGVRRILDYIVEGDVFQVNLSRQWTVKTGSPADPCELYRNLRRQNPGPFNGLARLGRTHIVSSSPERLVCVRDGVAETRPIAGTRPRGGNRHADATLSRELMVHPKERAEHIMLIDLERNDLGRICQPGSIEVNELMSLESYAHVHHIVSNVRGRLRAEISPGQVIRAVFPGGTITGCPKVRCMEIIAELEATGRGAYTGSMGYLNSDGSMDLNILIRTMVNYDDIIRFRAGAGIVSDSDPDAELGETRAKARGMLRALDCMRST